MAFSVSRYLVPFPIFLGFCVHCMAVAQFRRVYICMSTIIKADKAHFLMLRKVA